ncbi:hypothetical protein [Cellulomonas hominis]
MDEPAVLVSVGGHSDELATAVGHVVLRCTELDHEAYQLVSAVLGDDEKTSRKSWGKSGEQLVAGLRAAALRDGRIAAAVDPFRSVSQRRNQVVHAQWFADDGRRDLYESVKPALKISGETHDRDFTLDDLRTLASDAQRVCDYIWVLCAERTPLRQYGTGEIVERTPIALPNLDGIEPPAR